MGELDLLHEWDTDQQAGGIGSTIARRTAVKLAKARGLLARWKAAGGNPAATAKLAVEDGCGGRWMYERLRAARGVLKNAR